MVLGWWYYDIVELNFRMSSILHHSLLREEHCSYKFTGWFRKPNENKHNKLGQWSTILTPNRKNRLKSLKFGNWQLLMKTWYGQVRHTGQCPPSTATFNNTIIHYPKIVWMKLLNVYRRAIKAIQFLSIRFIIICTTYFV